MNNAFKSQSRENSAQLPATSLSPQKRCSERLGEGSSSKRLRNRFVGTEPENSVDSSQPSRSPNDGRLKRPTWKPETLGRTSMLSRTGRNSLDMPPDPPGKNTIIATSKTPEALHPAQEVQSASDGAMEDSVPPAEARADGGLADSTEEKDGPTDGNFIKPSTPRGPGRPRKHISEKSVVEQKGPKRPRGRPRAGAPEKIVIDPKAPPPRRRTSKQGREEPSPGQDTGGQLDQLPSNVQFLERRGLPLEQRIGSPKGLSDEIAETGINATSGSQTTLPEKAGISEQPDETTRDSQDHPSSGTDLRPVENASEAQTSAEESDYDVLVDSSKTGDEVRADGEDREAQPETRTDPELFDQEDSWSRIIKAARKLGRVRVNSGGKRKKIPVETKTVQTFVNRVKEASACYQALARHRNCDKEANDSIESRLKPHRQWLHLEADALSESHAGNKLREMVKDLYAHAIPQMVFLLKDAFRARSSLYSAVEDTQILKEIMRLMKITETLCRKARGWSVNPNTELPIIEPTSKVIYPSIRGMLNAFQVELDDRLGTKHRARIATGIPEMHLQRQVRRQKKLEQTAKIKEEWCLSQSANVDIQGRVSSQVPLRPSRPSPRPSPQQAPKQDQWSDKEDEALLTMLMHPAIASQPRRINCFLPIQLSYANCPIVEQRYTSALNTPNLQNKLPEHIEKRAMELKPSVQRSFRIDNKRIPAWVSSLQHLTAVHSTIS